MTQCLREAVADDNAKGREAASKLAEMNLTVNSGAIADI
jgi:hypothetical protein